jgi:hypothetical protein
LERQYYARPALLTVLHQNGAAEFLHELTNQREAEAGPFPDRLGGKERLQDAIEVIEPGPVVLEPDHAQMPLGADADRESAVGAAPHGVEGVVRDVDEGLLQPQRLGPNTCLCVPIHQNTQSRRFERADAQAHDRLHGVEHPDAP